MFHQAHPDDGRPHWIMQWVYWQSQTIDGLRRGRAWVWSTQVQRDPIFYCNVQKHSFTCIWTPIKGPSTCSWSDFHVIHFLNTVSGCLCYHLPDDCWTLANKNQRNSCVRESVGSVCDVLSTGNVTMAMADSRGALWPLNYSSPEKLNIPTCIATV